MAKLFAVLLFYSVNINAQNKTLDSIKSYIASVKEDTSKVNTLNNLCLKYEFENKEQAKKFIDEAISLSTKLAYRKGLAQAYLFNGYLEEDVGNFDKAITDYRLSLKINSEIDNKKGVAASYNNIGNASNSLGKVAEAIWNYTEAQKIFEELKDKKGIAASYNNLAIIYGDQGNYAEALTNQFKSLRINEELNDKPQQAKNYVNIGNIYISLENFTEALKYQYLALDIDKQLNNQRGVASVYSNIGIILLDQNRFDEAETNLLQALKLSKEQDAKLLIGNCYSNLGLVNKMQNKLEASLANYSEAFKIYEEINNKNGIAASYLNIGNCYAQQKKITDAYNYINKSLAISLEIGSKDKIKDCYKNLTELDSICLNYKDAYAHQKLYVNYRDSLVNEQIRKQTNIAKQQYEIAKKLSEEQKQNEIDSEKNKNQKHLLYAFIASFLIILVVVVLIVNHYRTRLKNLSTNLEDAPEIVVRKMSIVIISIATSFAAIIWAWLYYYFFGIGLTTLAPVIYFAIVAPSILIYFIFKKEQLLVNIQLFCIFVVPIMMEWTSGGFQSGVVINWSVLAPVGALMYKGIRQATWWMIMFVAVVIITILFNDYFSQIHYNVSSLGQSLLYGMNIIGPAIVIYFSMQYFVKSVIRDGIMLQENNKTLSMTLDDLKLEKEKTENLLLNILPEEVAEELKRKGEAEARQFNNVTVLFTDFVGFSIISEKLSPQELVAEIHLYFKGFDAIMEKYGIEKIKTIGDSYLAVCGLPNEDELNAFKSVQAAIEITNFIKERKKEGGLFDIRIGIHTGSLVAGIVGVKKFAYDIWGDTVNIAARMEQNGQPGRINISSSTFQIVKGEFNCLYRGKIAAKNKGEMDMYFVEGL